MMRSLAVCLLVVCLPACSAGQEERIRLENVFEWYLGATCSDQVEQVAVGQGVVDRIIPIETRYLGRTENEKRAVDGRNVITCGDEEGAALYSYGNSAWQFESKIIFDCDIWIFDNLGETLLSYVIAHEAGHCAGLFEHSTDTGALMFRNPDTAFLQEDDLDRLTVLYCDNPVAVRKLSLRSCE